MMMRYGDAHSILKVFAPANQFKYVQQRDRCFIGHAPTLAEISTAYDEQTALIWTQVQLKELSEYCGVKEKPSADQLLEMAKVIQLQYFYLKTTELMVFFIDVKGGKYGEFYGTFDAIKLMSMLNTFIRYRSDMIDRIQREQEAEKRRQERQRYLETIKNEHNDERAN